MNINRHIGVLECRTSILYSGFLIVAGGIIGLFTAFKMAGYGHIVVLTKKNVNESNTRLAQGGIAAAIHEEDSPFLYWKDSF